jgi:hypothetical protein
MLGEFEYVLMTVAASLGESAYDLRGPAGKTLLSARHHADGVEKHRRAFIPTSSGLPDPLTLAPPKPPSCHCAPDKSINHLVNDNQHRACHGDADSDRMGTMPVHPDSSSEKEHPRAP